MEEKVEEPMDTSTNDLKSSRKEEDISCQSKESTENEIKETSINSNSLYSKNSSTSNQTASSQNGNEKDSHSQTNSHLDNSKSTLHNANVSVSTVSEYSKQIISDNASSVKNNSAESSVAINECSKNVSSVQPMETSIDSALENRIIVSKDASSVSDSKQVIADPSSSSQSHNALDMSSHKDNSAQHFSSNQHHPFLGNNSLATPLSQVTEMKSTINIDKMSVSGQSTELSSSSPFTDSLPSIHNDGQSHRSTQEAIVDSKIKHPPVAHSNKEQEHLLETDTIKCEIQKKEPHKMPFTTQTFEGHPSVTSSEQPPMSASSLAHLHNMSASTSAHTVQTPPHAHEKGSPHLIPIPSMPTNSMMTPSMSMAAGMNFFPPHMMNPYLRGMMFDPRMAAFQHPMFRGMPPIPPRFLHGAPPQRQPRSRGPRGPRQSKASQQNLHSEILKHHNTALESVQSKANSFPESMTDSSHMTTNKTESPHTILTQSSMSRSEVTFSGAVVTHQETLHSSSESTPSSLTSAHQQTKQPPPAHYHEKQEIVHGQAGHELPPPAHASHPSLYMTKSTSSGQAMDSTSSKSSDTNTGSLSTSVPSANSENTPVLPTSVSIKQESGTDSDTSKQLSTSDADGGSKDSASIEQVVSRKSTDSSEIAQAPLYENNNTAVNSSASETSSIQKNEVTSVTSSVVDSIIPSSSSVTTSLHMATTVSTPTFSASSSEQAHQQSHQSGTIHGQHPEMVASTSSTNMPKTALFHPQGKNTMPGIPNPPMMQQQPRSRGPRIPKQHGGELAPGMIPPGFMPQFARFPHAFNPFMAPHIARMAMSPEMMSLAQRMTGPTSAVSSSATASEGEQTGVPSTVPKFEGITPNQMESFIRSMRMRPPHFGLRPGMPQPSRGMPPPPMYPGLPMPPGHGDVSGQHRFPGMLPHPSAPASTSVTVTSPTSSVRSVQMSPSQSPHPSPLGPSASPMSSRTGDKTPSPVPRSPANSDTTSVGSTPIKQEPIEQRLNACFQEDMDAVRTATQNALLKQLLANSLAIGGPRPPGTPFSEDSEDGSSLQLTPEQQKQLEMIESMPVVREVELTPEDWQAKTPEEREKILELRKQAFEEKRREFEDVRKKRKPSTETKKKKPKKDKLMDPVFPDMFVDGQLMMQQPQLQPPPKKRQRRPKQKKVDLEEDKDVRTESFLQQLRMLANVPLQEPKVTSAIVNSPVHGSAAVLTGDSQLKGDFGNAYLEGVADFYGSTLLGGLPPLGSLVGLPQPRDLEARHKFQSDIQDATGQQRPLVNEQGQPLPGMTPFSISSLTGPPVKAIVPVLPAPPRIEPRVPVHDSRMIDSPDTIISSSSPEHEFGMEELDFPMLKPIDPPLNEDNRCSPSLPLVQPIACKAEPFPTKEEEKIDMKISILNEGKHSNNTDVLDNKLMKHEQAMASLEDKHLNGKTNSFASSLSHPLKDKDISVTLTLSAKAAEDIGGVLSSIAELLKIAVPPSYEVSPSPSPDLFRMNLKHKEDPINIHNLIKMKPKFCRNCDMVVLDKGYFRKKSEMPFMIKEDHFTFKESEDEDIAFCSQKCYDRFIMVYKSYFKSGGFQNKLMPTKDDFMSDRSPSVASLSPFPATSPTVISPKGSGFMTPNSSGERTPQLTPTTPTSVPSLASMEQITPIKQKLDLDKISRKHKKDSLSKPPPKKWKNLRYKKWDPSLLQELQPRPETPKSEVEVLWKALGTIITPDPMPEDKRICVFCQGLGDGVTDGPGRLLNMDVDKWVHLNCALWSSEVYETLNGDLMNVEVAHGRSKTLECHLCKKLGATLGCFKVNCSKVYHLGCAQKCACMFFQDKTILCPPHAPKIPPDNVLTNLSVHRKVYVNRDEDKQVASMIRGQEEGTYALRISSLILHSVGQLLPHQIATGKFHTRDFIYPVGFKSSRFYWSMRRLYKRCRYVCSINDKEGKPEFIIRVVEAGFEDIVMKDNSPRSVWFKVLEPLDKMRRNADLVKIFPNFMTGEELFGLTEPAIIRVIESLPGTDLLKNYAFKFGRCELIEMPLTINPSGCARTEPKLRTHFRKMHTLQSSHTSRSLPAMVTGFTGDINSPYMKQFVHSKSQQYRRLKTEWRTNVFLGRSRIQGLGLFAARDLEKHTMVIEYIGYLIRDEVANRLEIAYDEQNRGVYMFRIDSDVVVDATMAGGPARYINHSCDPNCVAEVVPFDKESKIIIITNRRIPKGEELTYDYKFDFEDEQHKIPCCCGAKRCRKWMN